MVAGFDGMLLREKAVLRPRQSRRFAYTLAPAKLMLELQQSQT